MSVVTGMNNAAAWMNEFSAATFRLAGASFVAVFAIGVLVWTIRIASKWSSAVTMFFGEPPNKRPARPQQLQPLDDDD